MIAMRRGLHRRRSRAIRVLAAFAVAAALAAATLVGRWTAPDQPPAQPTPHSAGAAAAGIPPFAHSPQGAAAAAAWYVTQIYGNRGRPADQVRQRFAPLATRSEALDRLVALAATDVDGTPVPAGSLTRAAVIGVKQNSYAPAAARVAVWAVLIYANPGAGPDSPSQRWLINQVSLQWRDGLWAFATTHTLQAPMPPPHSGQDPNAVGTNTELLDDPGLVFQAVPDGR